MPAIPPLESTAELREYINDWIRNDATPAFQALRMNTILISLADFIDGVIITGGGEPTISAGSVGQFFSWDKTWRIVDKTTVGLGNVVNVNQTVATNLTSGSIPAGRYGALTIPVSAINATGTADSSTVLFGDGTWGAVNVTDGDKGDITVLGTSWTINDDAITINHLPEIPANRLIGRISGGVGDMEILTGSQATTMLDVFSSTIAGIVPFSGGGTVNFLRADGTWSPPGTGATLADADYGDVTVSSGGTVITIDALAVTNGKINDVAFSKVTGTISAAQVAGTTTNGYVATLVAGVPTWQPSAGGGSLIDGDYGDIVLTGSGTVWTIENLAVTLPKMQSISTATILGRATAGSGIIEVLSGTQATELLNIFTTSLKGLVPAASGGSTTTQFLRKDGTWDVPVGGFTVAGTATDTYVVTSVSGTPTWVASAGGSITPTAIGATPNANGMSFSAGNLNLQPVSALFGGVLTTIAQTIPGRKSLTSQAVIQGYSPRLNAQYIPTERTPATITNSSYNAFGFTDIFPDGTLVMICKEGAAHTGGGLLIMRKSTDQGQTWTRTVVATWPTGGEGYQGMGGGVSPTGRLIVFYFIQEDTPPYSTVTQAVIYSDDQGTTWSSPVTIPYTDTDAAPYGKLVKISGSLMLSYYGITGTTYTSYILRSADDGATWGGAVVVASNTTDDYTESTFEYLGGNTIIGLLRSENVGQEYGQFISTDNGNTWTDQGDVAFGDPSSPTPAWLNTYEGPNGKRVMVAYYRVSTNIKAVYGYAKDIIAGVSGWDMATEVTVGTVTSGSSGYFSAVHPYDRPAGIGWYYSETTPSAVTEIKWSVLPVTTALPLDIPGIGAGSSKWTNTAGAVNIYRDSWVLLGDGSVNEPVGQLHIRDLANGLNAAYMTGGTGAASVVGWYFAEGETFGANTYSSFTRLANANTSIPGIDGGTFWVTNLGRDIVFSTANPGTPRRDIKIESSDGSVTFAGAYTFPVAIGTALQYLRVPASGTTLEWATPSGGGTPAGSNTQIQYNNSGAFGASANLVYNGTALIVKATSGIRLQEYTSSSAYYAMYADGVTPGSANWALLIANNNDDIYLGSSHTSTHIYAAGAAQLTATSAGVSVPLIKITGGSPGLGKVLTSDADGDATWQTPGSGVTTMAAIGSVPNANGASISGSTLTLQPADASFGGVLTTGTQTIAGDKTFAGTAVGLTVTASAGTGVWGTGTSFGVEAQSASVPLQMSNSSTSNGVVTGFNMQRKFSFTGANGDAFDMIFGSRTSTAALISYASLRSVLSTATNDSEVSTFEMYLMNNSGAGGAYGKKYTFSPSLLTLETGQLTIVNQYTPSSSSDATFPTHTFTADDTYLYYKTGATTWVRQAWSAF